MTAKDSTAQSDLFSQLIEAMRPDTTIRPLAAIWLGIPITVQLMDGTPVRTLRLRDGMFVRVCNGRIIDCGEPTHQIIGCRGTIGSSVLILDLRNVETDQPEELKLK